MHHRVWIWSCTARPGGKNTPLCGAPPSEHAINKPTVLAWRGDTPVRLPQHKFIVGEEPRRGRDD